MATYVRLSVDIIYWSLSNKIAWERARGRESVCEIGKRGALTSTEWWESWCSLFPCCCRPTFNHIICLKQLWFNSTFLTINYSVQREREKRQKWRRKKQQTCWLYSNSQLWVVSKWTVRACVFVISKWMDGVCWCHMHLYCLRTIFHLNDCVNS